MTNKNKYFNKDVFIKKIYELLKELDKDIGEEVKLIHFVSLMTDDKIDYLKLELKRDEIEVNENTKLIEYTNK